MTTGRALNNIQRVLKQQSPPRQSVFQNSGRVNNYAVVSNLERLEASSQPPNMVPQNSSPLRTSSSPQPRHPVENAVGGYSTRLVVRDPSSGGPKVGNSPLRSRSRSRSPTHTSMTQTQGHHMARGVRPNIDRE